MLKLLIVDDQKKVIESICHSVKWDTLGIEIIGGAANGQEGFEKALVLKPDIIITDIVMPYMDGLAMMEEIKKELPHIKFIITSCHDDFNFAKSALSMNVYGYVLKPIIANDLIKVISKVIDECKKERQKAVEGELLERQLNESIPLLREHFLKNLIYGIFRGEETIWESIKFLTLDIKPGMIYNILYLETDDFDSVTGSYSLKEKQLLLLRIKNIIQEFLSQKKAGYVISMEEFCFALIITLPKQDNMVQSNKFLMDLTTVLIDKLKQSFEFTFTAGIGSFIENVADLQHCVIQAKEATKLKFLLGKGQIIRTEDQQIVSKPIDLDLGNLQSEVKSLLVSSDAEGVRNFVDKVVVPSDKLSPEAYMQFICSCIINYAQLVLIEMGEGLKSLFDNENILYNKLFYAETIPDIKQWMINVLSFIQAFVQKNTNIKNKRVIDVIKRILEERYFNDLSLDDIAHEVSLSSSYTSYIFKQECGENIVEYLTRIRIGKSLELLKNPFYKIYEVAEMVGYTNKSYFCSLFKERTNMTPSEYRESLREMNLEKSIS